MLSTVYVDYGCFNRNLAHTYISHEAKKVKTLGMVKNTDFCFFKELAAG